MVKLGVNVDHVATLRQARGGSDPDPVEAAIAVEDAGGDGITLHLREDRRHIQDKDLYAIKKAVSLPINLEMACDNEITDIALDLLPHSCTLVPEKRMELTTEGGLDVMGQFDKVSQTVRILRNKGITVSLFIEPDHAQIEAAQKTGAQFIEIHTGRYAEAAGEAGKTELRRAADGATYALKLGLKVNAGHGLNYENVKPIISIPGIYEVNIGHSIISRAVFSGLWQAVKDMKRIIEMAE